MEGDIGGVKIYFLPRHGSDHSLPPHKINYRRNIHALYQLGVKSILSVNAIGGITRNLPPGTILIPDQVIDYTYGREHTFFDGFSEGMVHAEFTSPFSASLREQVLKYINIVEDLPYVDGGTYGCMQGPRLESAAEIKRLFKDGCTAVGMTAMPEASLARERGIDYLPLCPVVNWAAGVGAKPIEMAEIVTALERSVVKIRDLIHKIVRPV